MSQPCSLTIWFRAGRMSASGFASISNSKIFGSRSISARTFVTSSIARIACSTSFFGPLMRTTRRLTPETAFDRLSMVSFAAICPWLIITTRSQTSCTSDRMWEERMTVCFLPSFLTSVRISMICFGSRRQWLVQNQDRRVADQCLCQTDTLAVALGQVLDDTTGNVADAAQVAHVFQM